MVGKFKGLIFCKWINLKLLLLSGLINVNILLCNC